MYKSPIEKICDEIQTQMVQEEENIVMKAIGEIGVNVDKEELIKALQYDRNQYTKGYEDGKNEVLDKIIAEIEQIEINGHIRDVECFRAGINVALEIIDKYNAESEE